MFSREVGVLVVMIINIKVVFIKNTVELHSVHINLEKKTMYGDCIAKRRVGAGND